MNKFENEHLEKNWESYNRTGEKLCAHKTTTTEQSWYRSVMASILSFASLSQLLRIIGAGVIVSALGIFLMQGWKNGDDIHRYFLLLAQTGLLTIIGFGCHRWLKEAKSARLFLCLALISVTVNFAILGGLIYSQVQWDTVTALYPSFANWQADSIYTALLTTVGATVMLLPVVLVGFLTIARQSAFCLSSLFMLGNTLLLVPLRTQGIIGIAVLSITGLVLWQLKQVRIKDISLATLEGRFAQMLLLLPLSTIVLRELTLYSYNALLFAAIALSVFLVLRSFILTLATTSVWRKYLDLVSLVPALLTAISLGIFCDGITPNHPEIVLPVIGVSLASMIMEIASRSAYSITLRRTANIVLASSMMINLLILPSGFSAILCVLAGTGMLIYGFTTQLRIAFLFGLVSTIAGLGYQLQFLVLQFDIGNWISLAILGVMTILLASVLERYGTIVRHRFKGWFGDYQSWN